MVFNNQRPRRQTDGGGVADAHRQIQQHQRQQQLRQQQQRARAKTASEVGGGGGGALSWISAAAAALATPPKKQQVRNRAVTMATTNNNGKIRAASPRNHQEGNTNANVLGPRTFRAHTLTDEVPYRDPQDTYLSLTSIQRESSPPAGSSCRASLASRNPIKVVIAGIAAQTVAMSPPPARSKMKRRSRPVEFSAF